MNVRLESMCHGDGKIYLQLVIDRLRPEAYVTMEARLHDGPEVPAHLFPFRPLDESSQANFVVVLPRFDVREVELVFTETGLGDQVVGVSRLAVEINMLAWRSRFNSLVRADLSSQMLDIEREYCAERMNVFFTEAIDEDAEIIVKMLVDIPYDQDCDVQVEFFDDHGAELDLPVYPLVDEMIPASRLGEPNRLHVGFSVRVPKDDLSFTANVYDESDGIPGGFARFCPETYEPLRELFSAATVDAAHDDSYPEWYRHHSATLADLAIQRQTALPYEPLISLVMPLFPFDRAHARAALHALELQTYSNFELVVVDACREADGTDGLLDRWFDDSRFSHIAIDRSVDEATCALTGIMQSSGDYRAVLDPRVILAPEALFEFVRAINIDLEERAASGEQPGPQQAQARAGLVFSNHDMRRLDGSFANPSFKPEYSPDLLCSYDCIGPFVLVDCEVIESVAQGVGFVDEAFTYDLILKAIELAGTVERVDAVLYHVQENPRLLEPDQEAHLDRLERDFRGGRRVVGNHLRRLGVDAVVVSDAQHRRYQVKYRVPQPAPRVAAIIANRDQSALLDACLSSLFSTAPYADLQVVIVENGSVDPRTFEYYDQITDVHPNVSVMALDEPFAFPCAVNRAAATVEADFLLLLDNDTEFITPDAVGELVGHCSRADVGVVGAKLLFADDTIQHAGMAVGPYGAAGNLCVNLPRSHEGYMRRLLCQSNVSAVSSAAQMIDRSVFDAVGGYDERFRVGFYDVDFCLKVISAGYHIAFNPDVELYHYENATQGHLVTRDQRLRMERERAYLHYKWPRWFVEGDPYLSSCLDGDSTYFQLSED